MMVAIYWIKINNQTTKEPQHNNNHKLTSTKQLIAIL